MGKLSVLFLVVCMTCLLDRSFGRNYYIQTNLGSPDLLAYPVAFPAVWQKPDCDKEKDREEGGTSESSSSESNESSSSDSNESGSSESSESSSSEESKESGESEESNESAETKESEENKESKESKESKSEEESSGSESKEESSEESGEKKEEKKKKESKSLFPPRSYDFPATSKVQKIVYSPVAYLPYRSTYVVQPSAVSYPQKSGYQYVSVPGSSSFVSSYASPIMGRSNRLMNSPITRIVYSPSVLSYPVSSKSAFSPGESVYSTSWGSPLFDYFRK